MKLFYKLIFLFLTIGLCGCASGVKLKSNVFEFPVKKEINVNATEFFDPVGKDKEIVIKKSDVDIQKLGTYNMSIQYEGKNYDIKIKITDKEKPVIHYKKETLVFPLTVSLKNVNQAIQDNVVITDNYDKNFEIPKLSSLPSSSTEIVLRMKVKDKSGNESDEKKLILQFTNDGKKQKNLSSQEQIADLSVKKEKEEIKVKNSNKQAKNENLNPETDKEHEKTVEEMTKESSDESIGFDKEDVVYPEEELPILTVDNFPSYLLGNSGQVFATYEEANIWAEEQTSLSGGPWEGCIMEIIQPFDGNYANAGQDDTPWTINFSTID